MGRMDADAQATIVAASADCGTKQGNMSEELSVAIPRFDGAEMSTIAGLICLALTVLATLGGGRHHLFDLICAVPYTAAILWLIHKLDGRPAANKNMQEEAPVCNQS